MRLREPKDNPPETASKLAGRLGECFKVELITPLYGGGIGAGTPDEEMPVRASAIRGQLRFWWRLLNRGSLSSANLYRAEHAIWGGLADAGATASRIIVTVSEVVGLEIKPCAEYMQKASGEWRTSPDFPRGPGYVLFPGQGKADRTDGVTEQPHDIIVPGLTFTLRVEVPQGPGKSAKSIWNDDVLPALRWWASFGGLGARTRRGLGSVKVDGLSPVTGTEATAAGCTLVARPSVPKSQKAWTEAIDRLKKFRQGPDVGRSPGTPPSPAGRSRWPEADSIRQITGCHLNVSAKPASGGKPAIPAKTHAPTHPASPSFPRAAFGLPIITHFKGPRPSTSTTALANFDPDDTALVPVVNGKEKERMASPLILKAMWTGKDYAPIALLLPHNHVSGMDLKLKNNPGARNPSLPHNMAAGVWWPSSAQIAMTGATSPNPLKGGSGDVLKEFLDYFKK